MYAPKALEGRLSGLVPKPFATAGLPGARKRRGRIGNGMKLAVAKEVARASINRGNQLEIRRLLSFRFTLFKRFAPTGRLCAYLPVHKVLCSPVNQP